MKKHRSHSEEAKIKMSETRKARIAAGLIKIHNKGDSTFGSEWRHKSQETFVKLARAPRSEDHKTAISTGLRGHIISPETRAKISEQLSGERNPRWKGGVSGPVSNIRNSLEYKAWRMAVLERDKFKCVFCGSRDDLQADHIKQFAHYPELRFVVSNGRTLCKPCHKEVTRQQARQRRRIPVQPDAVYKEKP